MTTLDFMDLTSEVGKVRTWLWHKRLPQGRVVVIDGDPAVSKSLFTVTIGAILSRGDELPFTEDKEPTGRGEPKTVVYLNYEDDALDIANRAVNAGADLEYFHAIKPLVAEGDDSFLIRWPEDRDSLRDLIQVRQVDVLVIDPMSTFFSGLKMNDTGNMSQAMAEVNQLATETNCTIIMIRHIGKGGGGGKPTSAGLGSVSITGTTRVGYILAADPDDPDLAILAPSKFNCGKKPNAISYRIKEVNGFPVVEWVGESELTAVQLLGQ